MSGAVPDKASWRRELAAARAAVPVELRAAEAVALAAAVAGLAGTVAAAGTVCGYLPVGVEPGSVAMLDTLCGAGHEVLLPVVPLQPGPLDWARYTGPAGLAPGPLCVPEPTGPRLGPATLARAGLVLVPALGVDLRGVRLGRGGGYYDRTLPLAAPDAALVAVVRDDELVARLPGEPHDVRVGAALCPRAGVVRLALPDAEC